MDVCSLLLFLGLLCFCGGDVAKQVRSTQDLEKRAFDRTILHAMLKKNWHNETSIPLDVWQHVLSQISTEEVLKIMLEAPKDPLGEQDVRESYNSPLTYCTVKDPQKDPYRVNDILFPTPGESDPNPQGAAFVGGLLAPNGGCAPYLQAVPIPEDVNKPKDPNEVFWPPCTPVEQCGGCCGLDYLKCVPTESEMVEVLVLTARYPYIGADRFTFTGMVPKFLEKHLSCSCQCRVQEIDCDINLHTYLPDSCRCKCKNEHLASTCPLNKKWSESRCRCECIERHCYEDEVLDLDTCSCRLIKPDGSLPDQGSDLPSHNPCADFVCSQGYEPRVYGTGCRCELFSSSFLRCLNGGMIPEETTTTPVPTPFRGRNRGWRRSIAGSEKVEHRSVKNGHVPMIVGKK